MHTYFHQYQLLLMALICHGVLFSEGNEFLYPVDHIVTPDGVKICVIHQKDDHLDVWLWNPQTGEAVKGLLSSYIPAGLSVCPSRNAFCFIDNDRLYIKSIIKKSPYAIDFMGPYELSKINWIDDNSFYFSAKERTHYNLFYGTISGSLYRLTYSKEYDYLYPQKQESMLFFIRRDAAHLHTINAVAYPFNAISEHEICWQQECTFSEKLSLIAQEEDLDHKACSLIESDDVQELYRHDHPGRALSFLHMVSPTEGFFAEHPAFINKKDLQVDFAYYQLSKNGDVWSTRLLFGFSIPTSFLFSHFDSTRLYESMYPLLPNVTCETIYFVSGSMSKLGLFAYERATGTITEVSDSTSEHSYFAPYIYNNMLICGGALARLPYYKRDRYKQKISLQMSENGYHTITLPTF